MKTNGRKTGLTLVEMLMVVGIIVILVSITFGIAAHIENKSKERLTKSTISLLNMALRQYADYGYRCRDGNYTSTAERDFYLGLDFPIDCNGFEAAPITEFQEELRKVLGLAAGAVAIVPVEQGQSITHESDYSGAEAMYFFLSRVPDCRKTLDRIDASLLTDKDRSGNRMKLRTGLYEYEFYPLIRVTDPWRRALRYDYYDERAAVLSKSGVTVRQNSKKTFPVITSAGPDGKFDTADDITGIK